MWGIVVNFECISKVSNILCPSLSMVSWVSSFQCLTDSSCSVTSDMTHIREELVVSCEDIHL